MNFLSFLRSNIWAVLQYFSIVIILGSLFFLLYFYWARYSVPTNFELDSHKIEFPFVEMCDLDSYMLSLEYEDHASWLEFRPYYPLCPEKYGRKYNCLELSRFYSWAASMLDVKVEICYYSNGWSGHTWCMIDGNPIDWSVILSGHSMEDFNYEDYKVIH